MKRAHPGFSLAELLVAIALTGLLFSAIASTLFQMTTISGTGNDQLTIWHELQNVTDRLETDCQAALTASGGSTLTLVYPSGGTVTYALSGTRLQRTSGATANTLAQDISSLNFSVTGRMVSMNVTSTVPGRTGGSAQISSLVNLRPNGP